MLALLSACASVPATLTHAVAPPSSAQDYVESAIQFMEAGEGKKARAPLKQVLRQDPANKQALSLLAQIEKNPEQLLGPAHFSYTVKPGETLAGLAARFLNDGQKFYALGRYNGLTKSSDLHAGLVLRIPGELPRSSGVVKVAAAARLDPVRAQALRGEALVSLSRGAAETAVPKLEAALGLDPSNKLIQRDLERARRLQKAAQ